MVTRGLDTLYEGITIATVQNADNSLFELVYGSAVNLVTAVYEKDGKRAVIDGGFTRLFCNWDTAGTGFFFQFLLCYSVCRRYVVNAAAWLANCERFIKPVFEFKPLSSKTPHKPQSQSQSKAPAPPY